MDKSNDQGQHAEVMNDLVHGTLINKSPTNERDN